MKCPRFTTAVYHVITYASAITISSRKTALDCLKLEKNFLYEAICKIQIISRHFLGIYINNLERIQVNPSKFNWISWLDMKFVKGQQIITSPDQIVSSFWCDESQWKWVNFLSKNYNFQNILSQLNITKKIL